MKLEIQVRHSDYGADAGGYRALYFDGEWIGRVDNREAGEALLAYVRNLEEQLTKSEERS